jgi:hypothetical protein
MFNIMSIVSFFAMHEDFLLPKVDNSMKFDYTPALVMMQIYTMFLTDILWWKCSINFLLLWFLHYARMHFYLNPGIIMFLYNTVIFIDGVSKGAVMSAIGGVIFFSKAMTFKTSLENELQNMCTKSVEVGINLWLTGKG